MAILVMPAHEPGDKRGRIMEWYKKTGDWVRPGDKLFSYSMPSGTYVAVSEQEGRLTAIYLPQGEMAACPADAALLSSPTAGNALRMSHTNTLRAGAVQTRPQEEEPERIPVADEQAAYEEPQAKEEDSEEIEEQAREESAASEAAPRAGLWMLDDEETETDEEAEADEEEDDPLPEEEAAPEVEPLPVLPAKTEGAYALPIDVTALLKVEQAFVTAANALDLTIPTRRTLLIYAAARADSELMGLSQVADLPLAVLTDARVKGKIKAACVRCSAISFSLPPIPQGESAILSLCQPRYEHKAFTLALRTTAPQKTAEAFLLTLREILENIEQYI